MKYTGGKNCLFICTMRQTERLTFYRMVRCSYHRDIHHYYWWSRIHGIFIALLASVLSSSSSSFLISLPQQFFDPQHLSREGENLHVPLSLAEPAAGKRLSQWRTRGDPSRVNLFVKWQTSS